MSANRKINIKRYTFLTLALIIAYLIFWFSSRTAQVSSGDSNGFIRFIINLLPRLFGMTASAKIEIPDSIHEFIRKTAHFSIYAALGICVFYYVFTYVPSKYVSSKFKAFFVSTAVCFLYACTDEFHQLFIVGRSCEIRDIIIDTCGAAAGMCLASAVLLFIKRRRDKKCAE